MSYYFLEKRDLTEVTLPVNCEKWRISSQVGKADYHGVQLHNHEPLELIAILSGTILWTADTRTYTLSAGDVLVLNPYVLHSAELPPDSEAAYYCITFSLNTVLGFRKSVLNQAASAVTDGKYCFDEYYPANDPDAMQICDAADAMYNMFHKKTPDSECAVMTHLYHLLTILLCSHYHENRMTAAHRRNKQFLQTLSQYLEENYPKPITSKEVSHTLYLSPSRFSHVFHQHFGVSFPTYLCRYRVQRAAALYAASSLPITEIAEAVGFSDYCYFSRSFKKYIGITPAKYYGRWKTAQQENEKEGYTS